MNLAALTANLPQGDQLRGAVLRADVMLLRINSALESRRGYVPSIGEAEYHAWKAEHDGYEPPFKPWPNKFGKQKWGWGWGGKDTCSTVKFEYKKERRA